MLCHLVHVLPMRHILYHRYPTADHTPILFTHHPWVNLQKNPLVIHLESDWLRWIWRTYYLDLYYILLDQKIIL